MRRTNGGKCSPHFARRGDGTASCATSRRARDVDTVRAFAARAERELGIARRDATAATATLLATIEPVLAQWRLRPTPEHAARLEDIYMGMVHGALRAMRR